MKFGYLIAPIIAPILRIFLALLEKVHALVREKSPPIYPYDKMTNTINLPPDIERKLLLLISTGNKVEAVKKVARLTGAGLRISKDYVDNLAKTKIK